MNDPWTWTMVWGLTVGGGGGGEPGRGGQRGKNWNNCNRIITKKDYFLKKISNLLRITDSTRDQGAKIN